MPDTRRYLLVMMMDNSAHDAQPSLNRVAFSATLHCLTGCSIGEILGMVIGSAMSLPNSGTIGLSVVLAFLFGYSLTMMPLLRGGIEIGIAMKLAFGADTLSIAVMEIIDNSIMLIIPGAMDAGLTEPIFWGSLMTSLVLAGFAAFPVTRWLISRGRGHAVVQKLHASHSSPAGPGHGKCGEESVSHGDDSNRTDPKQIPNPRPDPAESAGPAGWLDALNSFLEHAFLKADRDTGC